MQVIKATSINFDGSIFGFKRYVIIDSSKLLIIIFKRKEYIIMADLFQQCPQPNNKPAIFYDHHRFLFYNWKGLHEIILLMQWLHQNCLRFLYHLLL